MIPMNNCLIAKTVDLLILRPLRKIGPRSYINLQNLFLRTHFRGPRQLGAIFLWPKYLLRSKHYVLPPICTLETFHGFANATNKNVRNSWEIFSSLFLKLKNFKAKSRKNIFLDHRKTYFRSS